MAVYLLDGEVLLDGGSVATSEDCCCGGCPCCPANADFPISGNLTIDASASFTTGYTRTYGDGTALPFTGTVSWVSSTPEQYQGGATIECECTDVPPNCDPSANCPANFGPYCIFDECASDNPPEPGYPFQYCAGPTIEVGLACISDGSFDGNGWYLRVFTGSPDLCGGTFAFQTDIDGANTYPGHVQLNDNCNTLPVGNWSIDLEYDSPITGSAHIDLTIASPTGACCQSYGNCEDDVVEADCSGTWLCPGTTCEDNAGGACCFAGLCFDVDSEADCPVFIGAVWKGACTDCAHETC